jgi:iron complex outermembrane recepter protein
LGSHIGNITDLTAAIQRGKPLAIYMPSAFSNTIDRPFQDVQHSLFKLKNALNTNSGKVVLTFGSQYNFRKEIDILRGDKNLVQLFKLKTHTVELIFDHNPVFKIFTGSVGLTAIIQENITSGLLKVPRTSSVLIPNFNNFTGGVFLIERVVRAKWELEGGLRYDYRKLNTYQIPKGEKQIRYDFQNNKNFTGTIGTSFRPNSFLTISANLSSAWRAPSVNELYSDGVHHGAASYEKGDKTLLPEKAINTSFTVNYVAKKLQGELHVYYNNIRNYIFLSPTGRPLLSIRGAFPEFYYTHTNASFQGFDLSFNIFMHKNISLNSKISYLKAQDLSNMQPLILIPANRIENTLKFEKNKTSFTLTNLWVAKQNRVPTATIFKDIPTESIFFNEFGGDYAAPPPAYTIWNAAIAQQFSFGKKQTLQLSISASNLLNTSYRDYLNRFRYFTDEMGRNFMIRTKYNF